MQTQVKPIELAAVGRVAKLGELYDARSDQFLHLSLIKSNLPNTSTTSTQNRQTKLKYSMVNTLEEKFRTLDIQAELKLSIMGGLFDLEGSGKFFKDTKRSGKSAKASLVSSFSTEYEQMSITGTEVRNLVDLDALEQIDATHVVVGIQWGGNVIISVEDTNYDDQDQQKIEGNMQAQLQMLATQISGSATVKIDEKQRIALSKYNFEIYGDFVAETVPQTLIEAVVFMKFAPKILLDGNKGKGKAMKYSLIPISLLRQIFKITAKINALSNKIDEATVDSSTKLFDEMNSVEQKFNDILDELKAYEKYILTKKVQEFKSLYQEYKIYQSEVQRNLSEHLVQVRSGEETIDKLRNVVTQAYKNPFAFGNINFDKFTSLKSEFRFIKLLTQLTVHLIDKDMTMHEYFTLNYNKDIYIFFYKTDFPGFSEKPMIIFRNVLEKSQTYGPNTVFTAVKIDVLNDNEKKAYFNFTGSTKLSMFRNGQCIIEDYDINTKIPPNNQPELWSFHYMQTQLAMLIKNPGKLSQLNLINFTFLLIVPIGFIYVQLSGQKDPQTLWPNTQWNNVSPNYAGLFFRAEGGNARSFGTIQEELTKAISVKSEYKPSNYEYDVEHAITSTYDSKFLFTGSYFANPNYFSLNFRHSTDEIRPRNQAIRIWIRVK